MLTNKLGPEWWQEFLLHLLQRTYCNVAASDTFILKGVNRKPDDATVYAMTTGQIVNCQPACSCYTWVQRLYTNNCYATILTISMLMAIGSASLITADKLPGVVGLPSRFSL